MRKYAWLGFLFLVLGLLGCQKHKKNNGESPSSPFVIHFRIPESERNLSFSLADAEGQLTPLADDAFGKQLQTEAGTTTVHLVVKRDGEILDSFTIARQGEGAWLFAGSPQIFTTAPPMLPTGAKDVVVYFMPNGVQQSNNWGLHIWDAVSNINFTKWESPLELQASADLNTWGLATRLDIPPQTIYSAAPTGYKQLPSKIGLIVHQGDSKAVDEDIIFEPARMGRLIFLAPGTSQIYCSPDLKPCGWQPAIDGASAHWVNSQEIIWRVDPTAARYLLLTSDDASLEISGLNAAIASNRFPSIELTRNPDALASTRDAFPQLANFQSFKIDAGDRLPSLLKSELIVAAVNAKNRVIAATHVQLGGVLDAEFAYKGELGLSSDQQQLRLWAPTAQSVQLKIYQRDQQILATLPMLEERGVWSVKLASSWIADGLYYRFAMRLYHPTSGRIETYEVTDPYAVSAPVNARFSQLLDLNAAKLKPPGWGSNPLPKIKQPTDMVFYELHIRDFSSRDATVSPELQGTYPAFSFNGQNGKILSDGMRHLQSLQAAGLTHVQVLPAYDFGSVDEQEDARIDLGSPFQALCPFLKANELCKTASGTIFDVFASLPKDQDQIAKLNEVLREHDSFNWGYDPVHFGMPEGSYTTAAGKRILGEGEARVYEFRAMAQGLAEAGLHLAMDVVYNHSFSKGLDRFSVLDKVVPGYYHRLNSISGEVERSSCCENTASERVMMEKLMIDTLKRWHEDYGVDAFRFDLMGLHYRSNMQNIQAALGPDVFLFGEGWNMGELSTDARRKLSATQINMAGTGIATFNDRFRDAVRGGGPTDCGVQLLQQSPVNGLVLADNGRGSLLKAKKSAAPCSDASAYEDAGPIAKQQQLMRLQDRLRLGLAASLSDYSLVDNAGKKVLGSQLDYNGQAAGYAKSPSEVMNYVENHDNQTLWDINQLKLPYSLSMSDRVRVHNLGLSLNMLGMGVPYFEMGAEFLRSKSLVRDSYNAGDWYNQVDFSFNRSNWNTGLPPADKDGDSLGVIKELLQNLSSGPQSVHIQAAIAHFKVLLAIRKSSPLLRLSSTADVQTRLDFIGGTEDRPGLIAMRISDEICGQSDLDPEISEIVVVFNLSPEKAAFRYSKILELHPAQVDGLDDLVKTAKADGVEITVPGRTTAVFTAKQLSRGPALCRPEQLPLFN